MTEPSEALEGSVRQSYPLTEPSEALEGSVGVLLVIWDLQGSGGLGQALLHFAKPLQGFKGLCGAQSGTPALRLSPQRLRRL